MKKRQADQLLDRATEQIRARQLPEQEVEAISARVWDKVTEADAAVVPEVDELRPIRSCDDYQALLPAFIEGALPRSRQLLVESHTRECLLCRKALKAARDGRTEVMAPPSGDAQRPPYARFAVAAALVAMIGLGSYWMVNL